MEGKDVRKRGALRGQTESGSDGARKGGKKIGGNEEDTAEITDLHATLLFS